MGKTYIDAVKYLIEADVEISGIVEKPDVVGAIFGQTEGLIGSDLDLRELQKSGRIGRIEVELKPEAGKCKGKIIVPSSLDKVQTSIIAAALETVDKVGPCTAKIKVTKVDDTRAEKRNFVVDRAKNILSLMGEEVPETQEITDKVRDEVRTAEIVNYSPEELPAGPNIDSSDTVIVVEGRADVLQMLKNDIKNVIGMQGRKIPKAVVELSKNKTIILFVDGDRGGDLIVKEFIAAGGKIDFVAKAPAGKEVEELTQKEILQCLRRKVSLDEFMNFLENPRPSYREEKPPYEGEYRPSYRPSYHRYPPRREYPPRDRPPMRRGPPRGGPYYRGGYGGPRSGPPRMGRPYERREPPHFEEPMRPRSTAPPELVDYLKNMEGSRRAIIFDSKMKVIDEIPTKDLLVKLDEMKDVHSIILDGIVTDRLAMKAEAMGVKYLLGLKMGRLSIKPKNTEIICIS